MAIHLHVLLFLHISDLDYVDTEARERKKIPEFSIKVAKVPREFKTMESDIRHKPQLQGWAARIKHCRLLGNCPTMQQNDPEDKAQAGAKVCPLFWPVLLSVVSV